MDTSGGGTAAGGAAQIQGMATHGGRYVLYNVYGNLFEVASKYAPPIRPIGRGAYGIVWCVLPSRITDFMRAAAVNSESELLSIYAMCRIFRAVRRCLPRFGTHAGMTFLGIKL